MLGLQVKHTVNINNSVLMVSSHVAPKQGCPRHAATPCVTLSLMGRS